MTVENDFLPFAAGSSANVLSQSDYAALDAVTNGFKAGVAPSNALNKAWRQSSIMAAVIAQFIVAETGQAAIDDGTTATLLTNFTKAVVAASKQRVILTDTGTANAYAAANAVPMTALPTVSGIVQTVQISHANTTASTYAPDGLPTAPIFALGGAALQGSELPANGIATFVSYVGPLLNSGAVCWILYECIGGAQQVAPATQSKHAMQLGQATGRFLNAQIFGSSGTYTPTSGMTSVIVEVQGGGGGTGGAATTSSGGYSGSPGASSGSYAKVLLTAAQIGTSQPVTVGAAGTAGASGSSTGGTGGTSSLGSLVSCPGGPGSSSYGPTASAVTVVNAPSSPSAPTVSVGKAIDTNQGNLGAYAVGTTGGGVATAQGGASPMDGSSTGPGHGAQGTALGASSSAIVGNAGAAGKLIFWEYT
ncbi:hypothetical protein [Paraburkholderia tropica]|uniref:hypothetical protein n=1 Tax=Paraburkholderia tropica TaxID=92647 RepID=UPI003D2B6227